MKRGTSSRCWIWKRREPEIENLIARRLWKVFEFHLPDTPHRVARAMLKELNDDGYTIKKRNIKMKAGARK
jgi:hypothetical protein